MIVKTLFNSYIILLILNTKISRHIELIEVPTYNNLNITPELTQKI